MAASRSRSMILGATQNYFRLAFFLRPKWMASSQNLLRAFSGHCTSYHGNTIVAPHLGKRWKCLERTAAYSTAAKEETKADEEAFHNIIKDSEKSLGSPDKHEFQAETRMLLDIVAKSLYSEKEVFIRELISNASDALEKFRFATLTGMDVANRDRALEIHIGTDKKNGTFTIQDTGIGMTKEGLRENLGIIARSGSKAFLEQIQKDNNKAAVNNIIGQFGVGFYSSFMVANKVEVYTKSGEQGKPAYKWTSDGTGTYEISEADGVADGTKIVLYLKPDCQEFADEDVIKNVIKKYSNFVGSPIFLNGKRANILQAVWLMDPKDVTEDMHAEFFRFISQSFGTPRYTLHYRTDAPLSLRCLLYVPDGQPGMFTLHRDTDVGLALYSRKVLIKNKADSLLPKWLNFVKGVVDSEDIPLNLSRELLQDSALIRKLRTVLTNRFLRFLNDQARKDKAKYEEFVKDYGLNLKEGIIMSAEQVEKEEIGKLLRFESSKQPEGEKVSLPEYCNRMNAGQRDIYYLAAPSRHLAETSPYFEALKAKDVEVLFCYEPYDELVLLQLREFDRKALTSVEKEMRRDKEDLSATPDDKDALPNEDVKTLTAWLKQTLAPKIHDVRVTKRLLNHPCVVTVEEMGAARHFLRTQRMALGDDQRYKLLEPVLEINTSHPIIKKMSGIRSSNPRLAELVAQQLFDNAMVMAGLNEDPRTVLSKMNELLSLALEKH